MRNGRSAQKGFTLVEGILVILLIGILSATATSMFTGQKIFRERFFTDEVTQMIFYARKVAMTTECEVEITYKQNALHLLQREHCQNGDFTRSLPSVSLLDNNQQFEITVPSTVKLKGQFPLYIDSGGKFYEEKNKRAEKIAWQINHRILNIDPYSGFTYELP
jgi:prepilin-type N-terminal cleavage/methylation domain-containing protein